VVSTALDDERLPAWVTWQRRPFPDANLLLVRGRLLVVGDALSDCDVGWVNLALDGPDATALASLHRLTRLNPRVLLPARRRISERSGVGRSSAG
jgi:hypothetical protein